jgi:signal transduction histidine kinase
MSHQSSESPEVATIIHELAGILSSLQGFAEIVESRPEHPDREKMISLVRKEARRAAQALKDLQAHRAMDDGRLVERIESVVLTEALAESAVADLVPEDVPAVRADAKLVADVIPRCIELAAQDALPEIVTTQSAVEIKIPMGGEVDPEEMRKDVTTGRATMRPLALARRLFERWGGGAHVEESDSQTFVVLVLAKFDASGNPTPS